MREGREEAKQAQLRIGTVYGFDTDMLLVAVQVYFSGTVDSLFSQMIHCSMGYYVLLVVFFSLFFGSGFFLTPHDSLDSTLSLPFYDNSHLRVL